MMRKAFLATMVLATAASTTPARAETGYTERVAFSFPEDAYRGLLSTAYLLLDEQGGMNPLCEAIPMAPSGGGTWSTDVELPEGDYIYVFVANADQYVDLSDCGLNPDDVPDSNFFNDPAPAFSGLSGQFGKDNVYLVRSPNRPRFLPMSVTPKPGSVITAPTIDFSIQIKVGAAGTAIDPDSLRVRFETNEPVGVWRPEGDVLPPELSPAAGVSMTYDPASATATIQATVEGPSEGFHQIFFDAAGMDGLKADTFATALLINRDDQPPTADAGPTRFTQLGGETQLDGGNSWDPDRIGIAQYEWRIISGPGGGDFFWADEERVDRDIYGKPIFNDWGVQRGQSMAAPNATPVFAPHAAGTYVIGLRVKDPGGNWSGESKTQVIVVSSFDPSTKADVTVLPVGSQVRIDGRTSQGNGAFRWFPDAQNPAEISLSPASGGKGVIVNATTPGSYLVHLQVGNSYPTAAVFRVDSAGKLSGSSYSKPDRFWTEEAVMYMVFPRTFEDTDGDGSGDFDGIRERIPYLKSMGVNVLWMMPINPGPTSHGYANTAHFDVEEDYGTLEDFRELTAACRAAGIRVMFDFVANHTSNKHPFFQAAELNPESPLRDLYVFNPNGTYEYAFDFSTLPSWNYNNPIARRMFRDMIGFWMDQGVDAFRADIAGFVPPSFWRAVRREARGRSDDTALLAEIVPPHAAFFDGDQFDIAYDAHLFWSFKDQFATTAGLNAFDGALDAAETFVQDSGPKIVRERQDPRNVLRMRYLDNQDEDRFLLKAGRNFSRLKAAAGVLLNLPGIPMIFYGDETGAVQMRGPMKWDANPDVRSLYRRLLNVRFGNVGLRGQDSGTLGGVGDSFTRINSDNDEGGYSVYSFARWGQGQRFVVLVNRFDASVLGTQVKFWVPPAILADYPQGSELFLQNQLDPSDIVTTTRASLEGGLSTSVGAFETKVYQIVERPLTDADDDSVLDSWDNCLLAPNPFQDDDDRDGVGDACDVCGKSPLGQPTGLDGCIAAPGAPRARYAVHDGLLDDAAYEIAPDLWASWNGRDLYVATRAARVGRDRFVVATTDPTDASKLAAPFSKAGTLQGAPRILADEGDNDHKEWLRVTGQARAGAAGLLLGELELSEDGRIPVVEGTLNLQEQYGDGLPETLWLAALEYDGGQGGALVWQSPAQTNLDSELEAAEYVALALPDPTPPPPPGPPDADGDGLSDLEDNCPGAHNPGQQDFDGDGVGDLCDLCPGSDRGSPVDGQGCDLDGSGPRPPLEGDSQNVGCGCRVAPTDSPLPWLPVSVMLAAAWFATRRRRLP